MPYVLIAGINQTVRYDPAVTSSEVLGLATEGLKTCAAVIIRGENGRMSLTHCTIMTDPKAIQAEAAWVGNPFKITLVHNQAEIDQSKADWKKVIKTPFFPDIHITENRIINYLCGLGWAIYIEKSFNTEHGAVSIRKDLVFDEEPSLLLTPLPEKLRCTHFDIYLCNAINTLNSVYNNTCNNTPPDLIFDGSNFLKHPPVSSPLNTILSQIMDIINHRGVEIDEENILAALEQIDAVYKNVLGKEQGLQLDATMATSDRKKGILSYFKILLENKVFKKEALSPKLFEAFFAEESYRSCRM